MGLLHGQRIHHTGVPQLSLRARAFEAGVQGAVSSLAAIGRVVLSGGRRPERIQRQPEVPEWRPRVVTAAEMGFPPPLLSIPDPATIALEGLGQRAEPHVPTGDEQRLAA